ncbi:MAG: hypothetical protein ACOX5W_12570 [Bacillota bacterium]
MVYLLLGVGMMMVIFSLKHTIKYFRGEPQTDSEYMRAYINKGYQLPDADQEGVLAGYQELGKRLDFLAAKIESFSLRDEAIFEQIAQLNEQVKSGQQLLYNLKFGNTAPSQTSSFTEVLDASQQKVLYKEISEAYHAGKDITQLASEFNRGKGEIELILNLRP